MNTTTSLLIVSLGLLALSTAALPATAAGGCVALSCADVSPTTNITTTVKVCDNHGTIIQIGVHNHYCSQNGATSSQS